MGKFVFKKKKQEEVVEEAPTKKKGRPAKEKEEIVETKVKKSAKKETATVAAPEKKRGRTKGVKWAVNNDHIESLGEMFDSYEKNFKSLDQALTNFVEKGIKSSAKTARDAIMLNTKLAKEFRALIQEAKENMIQSE
jgi:hypothetical protein